MLNQPPKSFLAFCQIAGFSSDEVNQEWLSIWEKTIKELLIWLIDKGQLNDQQIEKLQERLSQIIQTGGNQKSVIDLVSPILDDKQNRQVIQKQTEFFIKNLRRFYTALESKMTIDERQTINALAKIENEDV